MQALLIWKAQWLMAWLVPSCCSWNLVDHVCWSRVQSWRWYSILKFSTILLPWKLGFVELVIFYFVSNYHGKSPSNHHQLKGIFGTILFQASEEAKNQVYMSRPCLKTNKSNKHASSWDFLLVSLLVINLLLEALSRIFLKIVSCSGGGHVCMFFWRSSLHL